MLERVELSDVISRCKAEGWTALALFHEDTSNELIRDRLSAADLPSEQAFIVRVDNGTIPDSIGQLTNLTTLYLNDNQLTTVPDTIGQLTNLTTLYLNDNQLTTVPDTIGQLTNLDTLYLNDNQLTTVPDTIGQLTKLTTLYLNDNQLTTVPDTIGQLTNLDALRLHNNQLTTVPDTIGYLTNLDTLWLDGNQLTTVPDTIGQLTKLLFLYFENNRLTSVPDTVGQLTNLDTLYLHGNQLTTVPDTIGQLTKLTTLYLHGNQLTTVPDTIGKLTKLTTLDLNDNQLTTVPDTIGQLTNLDTLWLDNNQLITVPDTIGQLTNLTTLDLHDNPVSDGIPASILEGRPADLIAYLADLRQEQEPLNELKLLILGRGGAGKSSIKDRLIHNRFDPNRPETPGVDIDRWTLNLNNGADIQVNVWDFAGQEIAHATHRFFLTERSLYLVVLDARSDTQDEDAEYWCRTALAFGGDSPIIVVLNKQIEKPFDVNRYRLKEKFPNIVSFVKTDCADNLGLSELTNKLRHVVADHPARHDQFPPAWRQLKDFFADVDALPDFQTLTEFKATCSRHGETDAARQERLARTLHALGLIIHYGDDDRLRDTAVLNPEWVTSGVYKLLRAREETESDGVLTLAQAQDVLPGEQQEQVLYLLNLMRRFELCFPLGDESWLVPNLLPKFQPELDPVWQMAEDAVRLKYTYNFVPEGLLAQLITRLHPLSEGQVRWRYGTVLRMEDATALVRSERQEVEVIALGPPEARRRLARLITTQFSQLHDAISGLSATLTMELSDHPGEFADVTTLEIDEAAGKPSATSTKAGTVIFDQADELNRISTPEARRREGAPLRAFLSYSHADTDMRDELLINLEILKGDAYLSTWTDAQILPSDRWDDEIRNELERADVIIFLVSSHMLSSPYIRGVELQRALERREAGQAEIVSIIVEDCSWNDRDFAEYQVILGAKPIKSHRPYRAAFNDVERELRRLIDSIRETHPEQSRRPRATHLP